MFQHNETNYDEAAQQMFNDLVNTKGAVILASTSPRRQYIFRRVFRDFKAMGASKDEPRSEEGENPIDYTARTSHFKNEDAWEQLEESNDKSHRIIVTGDTIAYLDKSNEILGKPKDDEDNIGMLNRIVANGGQFKMITSFNIGVVYYKASEDLGAPKDRVYKIFPGSASTEVRFKENVTPEMIADYVAAGNGKGTAGGIGLEGLEGLKNPGEVHPLVSSIIGCYDNALGLPINSITEQIRRRLVNPPNGLVF